MSVYTPGGFLTSAYDAMAKVHDSQRAKNPKKKLYLTPNFTTSKTPAAVRTDELIAPILTSFTDSMDPDRFKKAKKMFSFLREIPGLKEGLSQLALDRVEEASAILDRTRLHEVCIGLSALSLSQEFIKKIAVILEQAIPIEARLEQLFKTHACSTKKAGFHPESASTYLPMPSLSDEEVLSILDCPIGKALVASSNWIASDNSVYCINLDNLSIQELEELIQKFEIAIASDFAPNIRLLFQAQYEITKLKLEHNKLCEKIFYFKQIFVRTNKQLEDSQYRDFFHFTFPSFISLHDAAQEKFTGETRIGTDSLFNLYKQTIKAQDAKESLDSLYKNFYEDCQKIISKSKTSSDKLSSTSSSTPAEKFFPTFLTPEEFSAPRSFTPAMVLMRPTTTILTRDFQDSKAPKAEVSKEKESAAPAKESRKKAHRAKQKVCKSSVSSRKLPTPSHTPATIQAPSSCSSSASSSSSSPSLPAATPPSLSSSSSSSPPTPLPSCAPSLSTSSTTSRSDVAAPAFMPSTASAPRKRFIPPPSTLFANQLHFSSDDYAQRVIDWFESPEGSLSQVGYEDLTPHKKQKATWCHAFSPFVDKFVGTSYSYKNEWRTDKGERHTFYGIVGDVVWKGKTYKGVFQYCFDNNGVLYHRYFGRTSNVQLLDIFINRERPAIEYPSLAESASLAKAKPRAAISADGLPYEVDPLNIVSFEDPRHELSISVFKLGQRPD